MTKNTPGPWKPWMTGFDNQSFAIGPNGKTPIAKTLGGNKETNEANARLIAAAPDMLVALEIAKSTLEFGDGKSRHAVTLEFVNAAIAKAEGRAL